jgi:hypothetical protein
MADDSRRHVQFGLADVLLATLAAGLWLFLMTLISPRIPFALVAVVLTGITMAIQRLLRGKAHAWPLAATLAPIVSLACLMLAALWVNLR